MLITKFITTEILCFDPLWLQACCPFFPTHSLYYGDLKQKATCCKTFDCKTFDPLQSPNFSLAFPQPSPLSSLLAASCRRLRATAAAAAAAASAKVLSRETDLISADPSLLHAGSCHAISHAGEDNPSPVASSSAHTYTVC